MGAMPARLARLRKVDLGEVAPSQVILEDAAARGPDASCWSIPGGRRGSGAFASASESGRTPDGRARPRLAVGRLVQAEARPEGWREARARAARGRPGGRSHAASPRSWAAGQYRRPQMGLPR